MRKSFLIFILFFISLFIFSQETTYNSQKGYVAQGYDVVAYFSNKAIKGKKEFKTQYDNVTFLFSTKENLNAFLTSPKKFVPQYGGYCAYAIAINNKKASINPKTFEIRDEKLYLFYDSWGMDTLEMWLKNKPEALVKKADENWLSISSKK